MTRTTIDLDPLVLQQLKERQKREGKTLGQLVSELLAQALQATVPTQRQPELNWISKPMGGYLVDINDKDALHAVLDAGLDVQDRPR